MKTFKNLFILVIAGILACSFTTAEAPVAAVDYFLKLDGIDGESTDRKHKGEIEIESWSFGGATNKKLDLTKKADKASAQLRTAAASGKRFRTAVFSAENPGGQESMEIKMADVLISSYQTTGGGSSSNDMPMESFSLNYTKIEFSHTKNGTTKQLRFEQAIEVLNRMGN